MNRINAKVERNRKLYAVDTEQDIHPTEGMDSKLIY